MKRVRYDIDEDDEITGVKAISIVSDPAIESNFIVMSKHRSVTAQKLSSIVLRAFEVEDFPLIDRIAGKLRITRRQLHSLATRLHRTSRLRAHGFQLTR